MNNKRRHRIEFILLALAGLVAALSYSLALILDQPKWLRGVNWVWNRHVPTPSLLSATALIAIAGVWVGIAVWVLRAKDRWSQRKTVMLLAWAIVFTPLVQLTITLQHRDQPLSASFQTATAPTSGFFEVGVAIDEPLQFLQEHDERMPGYRGVHVRTQPPGRALAFYIGETLWERWPSLAEPVGRWLKRYDCNNYDLSSLSWDEIAAATLQMSILFLSGLGAVPLFLLGRRLKLERSARLAVVLYPLMPAFLVFQARFDVLYALLALCVLWLVERIIARDGWLDALFLATILVGWTLFATVSVAMIALANVFLIIRLLMLDKREKGRLARVIRLNGLVVGLLALVWGSVYLLWGVSWPEFLVEGRQIHHAVRISNPYWVAFNLLDLSVFMGLPLMAGVLGKSLGALRRLRLSETSESDAWTLAWVLFIVLLLLSGEVQAETGRLWMFIMPPGLLIASTFWMPEYAAGMSRRPPQQLILVVVLGFALQGLVTGSYLGGRPSRSNAPEAQWLMPDAAQRTSYQLGEHILLQGYEVDRGQATIDVTLYWQAYGWTQRNYSVFVHLLEDGELIAQSDGAPVEGRLPTLCWVPGEVVKDVHRLDYGLQEGRSYVIGVGIYQWRTGERLNVSPDAADDMILLPLKPEAS